MKKLIHRYLLTLAWPLTSVVLLSNCQSPKCCALDPSTLPSVPHPSDYHSDTAALAAEVGADYPVLRLKALKGDKTSLRKIFWLTEHAGFDGAAAEGHAYDLEELLHTTGDEFFGHQLQTQAVAIREEVQEMLSIAIGEVDAATLKKSYPKTFQGYRAQ